ncbi:MAG: portal protein, partial [Burkholderiales bacterium]
MNDETILDEARERFAAASDAESLNRAEMLDDLRFLALDQWPEELKRARENDPNGARPCLVLDKCNQHIRQIVNDMRQNRPSIKVRPVDDSADKDAAEVFSGLIRHIENRSGAEVAYLTAGEYAASIGRGFFRILTEYEHEHSFSQEIEIARIHNPFGVYLDPYSTELDGSDAEWAFVTDRMPKKLFERQFPNVEPVDIERAGIGDLLEWYQQDSVRVAEYFYRTANSEPLLLLADGTTAWGEDYQRSLENGIEPVPVVQERQARRRRVQWCKHTGCEILERREFPSSYIPIIPVYGNQFWLEGERRIFGAVRAAKDAQRQYNYSASAATELIALAPRAPFIGATGQFENFQNEWASANTENHAYLQYNPLAVGGVAVPPPQRQPFASVPQGLVQQLGQAEHDIQAALGQYNASLGAPSNEHSGVAIRQRQMESDMANSHYMHNLARSIEHAGYILVEMIPRVWDTRQTRRFLGEDGSVEQARIDPSMAVAAQKTRGPGKARTIYNLNVGRYDVAVTVGPGYSTRRQEAAEGMVQLSQANPQLMQIAGDLLVRNMDWPGAEQIADRLKRAIPPEIVGQEDGEGADIPPEIQAQMQQMQQQYEEQLAQAGEQMQAMGAEIEKAQAEAADKTAEQARIELDGAAKQGEHQLKQGELGIKGEE